VRRSGAPVAALVFLAATCGFSQANSRGRFLPAVDFFAGDEPLSVAVGDFNGDGKLDLAVLHTDPSQQSYVRILLGEGDGAFHRAKSIILGRYPTSIAAGDFNADGILDLVVVDADRTRQRPAQ